MSSSPPGGRAPTSASSTIRPTPSRGSSAMSERPGYFPPVEYSARWGIEPMFSDFKSRGFGIEDTQLRYADRLDRLILVMALALEFIPIKPLAATGSGGPGSYAGHSRFPSRHHGRPASTGGFDDATALDAAVDMLDPQSAVVERLVGSLLRPWQVRARWFLRRHEDLHLRKGE